jgi:transcriptional regulator GlxA family with amidase domain
MRVAVVTFEGFNEIDSIVAAHIINRAPGWHAEITAPSPVVTSMNGLAISGTRPLEFAAEADAVVIGSGRRTREMVGYDTLMSKLRLDPDRQLIASQCSGALVLIRLGLIDAGATVSTDVTTQPDVEAAGYPVLDAPFVARGNVATAGGCLSSHYLASWILWRAAGKEAALDALSYVLPRGQEEEYVARVIAAVGPFAAHAGASTA